MLVLNAISLNMVNPSVPEGRLTYKKITLEKAREAAWYAANDHDLVSAVGHVDTAALFSALLDVHVPCERRNVVLGTPGAYEALVGQYSGPRLPEGATTLPEGARVEWFWVTYRPGAELSESAMREEISNQWRNAEDSALAREGGLLEKLRAAEERVRELSTLLNERGQSSAEWLSRREGG